MSRFYESDDWDNSAQFLWESNLRRAIHGKNGQRQIREMIAALLALPERKLVSGAIVTEKGDVCAVGAYAKYKGVDLEPHLPRRNDYGYGEQVDYPSDHETVRLGKNAGLLKTLAVNFGFINDVDCPEREVVPRRRSVLVEHYDPERRRVHEKFVVVDEGIRIVGVTDEERWQFVYDWCVKHLDEFKPPALVAP